MAYQPWQTPPIGKTVFDLSNVFNPERAKDLPQTKFGILKQLKVYLWWSRDL